ncbi:MAG TPA: hypothetical protein VKU19_14360 [Bryobacteraceae bacterium]|nr:hypothetical protein [Bryobacteraceae bacterium]
MNDLEFKRHLKDLAHGHHHPEEHDWDQPPAKPKKVASAKAAASKGRTASKAAKKK